MFSRVDGALPNYSRTYRKQPPKMQRLSGRLREVVVYKNRTTEASSKERSRHIYFMEDNLLHAMSKLWHVSWHVVPEVFRIF